MNVSSASDMLRFPVCESDNPSFVKLISCWRDQSIEVRKEHHSKGLKSPQVSTGGTVLQQLGQQSGS